MDHDLGLNIVHILVIKGLHDLLAECLKHNPSLVNVKDNHGHSALHYAALVSHSLCFELLLSI